MLTYGLMVFSVGTLKVMEAVEVEVAPVE